MVSEKQRQVFLSIKCSRCGCKQVVYGRSAQNIKCRDCNKLLVKSTGGKAKVVSIIREVLS